jgi:hypothetical protein
MYANTLQIPNMIRAIRFDVTTCSWHSERVRVVDGVPTLGAVHLVPYCTKFVSDNVWIAAMGAAITDDDTPHHFATFPFPYMLPVYPRGDVCFVMLEMCQPMVPHVPFILGALPHAVVYINSDDLGEWERRLASMSAEASDGAGVYGMLQSAFDAYWTVKSEEEEDDFVADDDVATDLLLHVVTPAAQSGNVVAAASSSAVAGKGATAPTSMPAPASASVPVPVLAHALASTLAPIEDDWDEDEPVVDARTGFVLEQAASLSDAQQSDDSDSDDDSSMEDNDDDDDDDDDDDEDEDIDIADMDAATNPLH